MRVCTPLLLIASVASDNVLQVWEIFDALHTDQADTTNATSSSDVKLEDVEMMEKLFKSPGPNFAYATIEYLWIGVIFALISAAVFRKKK